MFVGSVHCTANHAEQYCKKDGKFSLGIGTVRIQKYTLQCNHDVKNMSPVLISRVVHRHSFS